MPTKAQIEKALEGKEDKLTQKELAHRWQCTVRTVNRHRKEFGLVPVDTYGVNPLFVLSDVLRVEEQRRKKRLQRSTREAAQAIVSMQALRKVKAKRGAR